MVVVVTYCRAVSFVFSKMNTRKIGVVGEDRASEYLLEKGYDIITRNFGGAGGEIDIIARTPTNVIVFVEVKYGRSAHFAEPELRCSPQKLARIQDIAKRYTHVRHLSFSSVRVDVIAIDDKGIRHYINCVTL